MCTLSYIHCTVDGTVEWIFNTLEVLYFPLKREQASIVFPEMFFPLVVKNKWNQNTRHHG